MERMVGSATTVKVSLVSGQQLEKKFRDNTIPKLLCRQSCS